MDFLTFCQAHGILIDSLPPLGQWKRYPTEDKPRHKNGAVKFMGDHGFVQNHATEVTVSVWKPDAPVKINARDLQEQVRKAEQETLRRQAEASKKAAWILHQCQYASHEYLKRKGHADEVGNVWVREGEHLLVIPMRVGKNLVGVQLIDEAGGKNFLSGQRTSEAEFVIDNKGPHYLCEGYATALSLRAILKNYKRRYTIHVTFSAGNMLKIAATLPGGYVIGDNDLSGTGERVAREIGWPYWISDQVGDCNDHHLREGLFRTGQSILSALQPRA
jgi:putative DNA primase/helicase